MMKFILLFASVILSLNTHAQASDAGTPQLVSVSTTTSDAERVRIRADRARLEASFDLESVACHEKFLVNNCLKDVHLKRRDALADLRRQDISLDVLERKTKAADQINKIEKKSSPEKQQQDAENRAAALKDFQARVTRDQQKTTDRAHDQLSVQAHIEATAKRVKGHQEKNALRMSKQAEAASEVKKFNARQERAQKRLAQREQANQTGTIKSLPHPE